MALRDFWVSARTGMRLLIWTATVDSPRLDSGAIERVLRRETLWLTPRAVAGFNEADFTFLPDAERTRLNQLVTEFREIASRVSLATAANDDEVAQALPLFRDIIGMLEFDRYGDAEAYKIGKQVEHSIGATRPAELAELRFYTGADNTGDPSIWIWAILKDEAAAKAVFGRVTRSIRELLTEAANEAAPTLWPYVGFRTVSEQSEILEAAKV